MHLSFRGKLNAIVAASGAALVVLTIAGSITSSQTEDRLADIQQRYLPKLELGPRLEGQFEHLRRAMQDSVAARDLDSLNASVDLKAKLLSDLAAAVPVITAGQVASVRGAIDDYSSGALDVSRRLISGETGERLVDAMAAMQTRQARALDLLQTVTTFDRRELVAVFADARDTQRRATRIRLVTSISCLACVLFLSIGFGRSAVRGLSNLAVGLRRFGAGEFAQLIDVTSQDEIGEVAQQANQMAASLKRLADERNRADWVKGALAGLARELRGELEPGEVANRAVTFLARYLGAPAAALYYMADGDQLGLLAQYAGEIGELQAAPHFRLGEGLVGQAALSEELTVIEDPPAGHIRVRSGLGASVPRALVLVPLSHAGRPRGVLELALFHPWSERAGEALGLVREPLTIAVEVARARARTRALLSETQRQAERLAHQEEELRGSNEELEAQQEEMRQTNRELTQQAEELEVQRQALEISNRELVEARGGLEQKAAELTTLSAYKSQFLANMSHELRTPLNSMLLLSNLLAENEGKNLTAKQVEYAHTIHAAGKDLLVLINQVLDLSKIEAGKHEVSVASVVVSETITHIERVFAPLARDKGLAFAVDVAPEAPSTMVTDKQRLEQILNNLLGNAIKFTRSGNVTLRVSRPTGALASRDDLVLFSVSDTGVGIAAADQTRIFAPFEQVDGAIDRRYGGTGLGLTISRELARLLGGELSLESTPGKGSTFSLLLPVNLGSAALLGGAGSRPESSAAGSTSTPNFVPSLGSGEFRVAGKPTLLIIEDDVAFADALAEIVRGQGIECLVAPDGRTGLRLAAEKHPAGIILDIKLPDIDGWQVIAELRRDDATSRIPVHFLSALQAAERGLALGAIGYLNKPASKQDILAVIEALMSRDLDGASRVLIVEDDAPTGDSVARQLAGEQLEVRRAMNASQALDALARERFGCMVLDLGLPDMDGLDLLSVIRERQGAEMPGVVVYTARALSRSEAQVLEAYTEAIVLKEGAASDRLMDEVRLFTRRLKEGLRSRHPAAAPITPADLNLSGQKVLIADDDMRTVYALSALLRSKGIDVLVADTGVAALATLNQHPDTNAVLMDVMMPEMDGLEATRRIRKDRRFAALLIVALTAKAMKGDRERCLEAGATEYLPKPADGDRLLMLLATHLAPRSK